MPPSWPPSVWNRPRSSALVPGGWSKHRPSLSASRFSPARQMAEVDTGGPARERDQPAAAYVAAFVLYVALGYFVKSFVLNWIVGPFFLVIVLYLLPRALRGSRSR